MPFCGVRGESAIDPLGGKEVLVLGCLRSKDMVDIMRAACVNAHPDPDHYLRLRLHCICTHSNRVTAAVALSNAGCLEDEIAFRLRWTPPSVRFYLRQCSKAIGRMTEAAITGSLLI